LYLGIYLSEARIILNLLLEIGTEEIPAHFIPSTLEQLKAKVEEALTANRIEYKKISVFSTPRRLVVFGANLSSQQKAKIEKFYGPPAQLAYDEKGQPTDKAIGFAKKQGIPLKELKVEDLPKKGKYVVAEKKEKGEPTSSVLSKLLPQIILTLQFPKSMRWGRKTILFARPIRWILAILGKEILKFSVAGIESANLTFGHHLLNPQSIPLPEADWQNYQNLLRKAQVVIDESERKGIVQNQIQENITKSEKAEMDEGLLRRIIHSAENPNIIMGQFSNQFLKLPEEVLVTAMKEELSFIPLRDSQGKVLPKFISVSNGAPSCAALIRKGNERIIKAKLYDAKFFFDEDMLTPLDKYAEKLDTVVVHQKLGTYKEKTARLVKLAKYLSAQLKLPPESTKILLRSAHLCKADQVTEMVKEFPSLEGVIGGKYAQIQGEDQKVARAISEHYLPNSPEGKLASTLEGRLLSLADKLDTVTGYFAVELQPTSSKDPYGVRKNAIGMLLLLIGNEAKGIEGIHLSILKTLDETRELLQETEQKSLSKVIRDFLNRRFENILQEKGIRYDIINATMSAGSDDYYDCFLRARAFEALRKKAGFTEIITPFKRAVNIIKQAREKFPQQDFEVIKSDLITHQSERKLYGQFQELKKVIEKLKQQRNYPKVLDYISQLRPVVDEYFDKVLVMDKNADLRRNHLSILKTLTQLFAPLADFSKLVEEA